MGDVVGRVVGEVRDLGEVRFLFSPQDLINFVVYRFQGVPVRVRGKVVRENGYMRIVDEFGGKVSLERVKGLRIDDGVEVEVEGILMFGVYQGGIYPRIDVRSFRVLEEGEARWYRVEEFVDSKLRELIQSLKRDRGFFNYFENLLRERFQGWIEVEGEGEGGRGEVEVLRRKIRVVVIYGRGAQTHLDFLNGVRSVLGDGFKEFMELKFVEVNLRADLELAEAIRKGGELGDVIFIVRGGGSRSELGEVGGYETVKAIVESDVPVYIALGHSLDRGISILEKVADKSFHTPSLAGVELGKVIQLAYQGIMYRGLLNEYIRKDENFKVLLEDKRRLESEKQKLERELEELERYTESKILRLERTNRVYFLIIFGLILFLVIYVFLR